MDSRCLPVPTWDKVPDDIVQFVPISGREFEGASVDFETFKVH
jgi:hypothetical protein